VKMQVLAGCDTVSFGKWLIVVIVPVSSECSSLLGNMTQCRIP